MIVIRGLTSYACVWQSEGVYFVYLVLYLRFLNKKSVNFVGLYNISHWTMMLPD